HTESESSPCGTPVGDVPAHRTICREEPVLAGKVTCGVRTETSGQSWPSNTRATDHRVCLPTSLGTFLAGDFNPATKVSVNVQQLNENAAVMIRGRRRVSQCCDNDLLRCPRRHSRPLGYDCVFLSTYPMRNGCFSSVTLAPTSRILAAIHSTAA